MGMSTSVAGFKPPDEKWKQMKSVYDACKAAKIDPPSDVEKFFNYSPPDAAGVEINQRELEKLGAVKEYHADMREGFDIDVTKLPKDVKIIRVWNSC